MKPNFVQKQLEEAISQSLKPKCFKKKGVSWYLETHFSWSVINLQKSWGMQFYVNLGAFLKDLEAKETPKEYECHLRIRLGRLLDDNSAFEKILDFNDTNFPNDEKIRLVVSAIETFGIPALAKFHEIETARDFLKKNQNGHWFILEKAKNFLESRPQTSPQ